MLDYPAGIDLSSAALRRVAHLIAAHRRTIASRWRRLRAGRQALLVLAHLRCEDTHARPAARFRNGIATVHRYVHETVDPLAMQAPTPNDAVETARAKAYVILDATLPPIDRITANHPLSQAGLLSESGKLEQAQGRFSDRRCGGRRHRRVSAGMALIWSGRSFDRMMPGGLRGLSQWMRRVGVAMRSTLKSWRVSGMSSSIT